MSRARTAVALGAAAVVVAGAALALVLLRENPVAAAAKDFTSARLVLSGERDGRSVRGTGAVDVPRDRARLELAESAPGLEHARGEGEDVVFVGDRLYTRPRFLDYSDRGEVSRWEVGPAGDGTFDPRAYVRDLRAADDVRELGEERIRDAPTTRYRARLNPREVVDVWIDERGRIARAGSRKMSIFFTYGKPVRIAVPDVSDDTPSD